MDCYWKSTGKQEKHSLVAKGVLEGDILMDSIQAVERQIDRAIYALDYLKVGVNLQDVLYMLQYSHDERKLTIDSWSEYRIVSENLLKRIAVYEGQKEECVNEAQEPCTTDDLTLDRFLDMIEERGLGSRLYTERRSNTTRERLVDVVEKNGNFLATYSVNVLHFFCERDMAKELDSLVKQGSKSDG